MFVLQVQTHKNKQPKFVTLGPGEELAVWRTQTGELAQDKGKLQEY